MAEVGPEDLRADCSRCVGLCCVAPAFAASADFAVDKPAGQPCPNLRPDFRCGIHADLRNRGFPGCTTFDCFGAGQRVTRNAFGGRNWRNDSTTAQAMFDTFAVVRPLHELLWHLTEALTLDLPASLRVALTEALTDTDQVAGGDPESVRALAVDAHRGRVVPLLSRAGDHARARSGRPGTDLRGAALLGTDLRRTDVRRATLRGAQLVGADLRGVDLTGADLAGADLRGADLRGANLSAALFVHQAQLDAARGDRATRLPPGRSRPDHWAAPASAPVRRRPPARGLGRRR
ncbi:pentapeptide repeat-containing protein [Salinispora arenicola]|uniref:Pentapeptide repeat protein n=1 Tax=Salinispora arenicola TaxID=168697 RepID=A0A542XRY5_SALAC|nr:pentapeptide repeat-containing protein [Salinispora arenicola]MCN0150881.1 pentapeptide repeat-containing protein [Salinispora arenicola]TQL38591.1 pentapeptide repeat protein [Salinispora arenicola]GIM84330.1 hypothetical protein Sar04_16730 [Salinispora arenicola]